MTDDELFAYIKYKICLNLDYNIEDLNETTEKKVWDSIRGSLNTTVNENIYEYLVDREEGKITEQKINNSCASDKYKIILKQKSEEYDASEDLLTKNSTLEKLFTNNLSGFHKTSKDFLALYCEGLGWKSLASDSEIKNFVKQQNLTGNIQKNIDNKQTNPFPTSIETDIENTEESENNEPINDSNTNQNDSKQKSKNNAVKVLSFLVLIAIIGVTIYWFISNENSQGEIPKNPKEPTIKDSLSSNGVDTIIVETQKLTSKKTLKISDLKDKQKPALTTVNDTISEQEAKTEDDIDKTIKRLSDSFMDTVLIKDNYKVVSKHGIGEHLLDANNNIVTELNGASLINDNVIITKKPDGIYGDKYGAINHKGETVIPFKYSRYNKLNNSLIIFSLNEIGNVDVRIEDQDLYKSDGVLLFKNCYAEQFSEFKDDVLPIAKGDKFGLLNKQGKLIVPFKYQSIEAIKNGFVVVGKGSYKRRKYGVINTKGVAIIPMDYKDVTVKSNNLFEVSKKNKRYTVNTSNTCVKDCD
ncbi:WG repeat-containing protein [Tenacibaculum agarivorans]|uniref:WG repeat-containing protein n=1 Tax=Tenacibaculum agarivorans TaxID=1908389 RepID=UPI00094B9C4B|nr:WG repeat-containing protein [Tenacibaculum agarivorans]